MSATPRRAAAPEAPPRSRGTRRHGAEERTFSLALLLPDGVGIRNFVLGGLVREALEIGEVHAIHPAPPDLVAVYAAASTGGTAGVGRLHWHAFLAAPPRRVTDLVRRTTVYAHMHRTRTEAMRRRLALPLRDASLRQRLVDAALRLGGRAAATPRGVALLAGAHRALAAREPSVNRYRALFRAVRPSVLFCSHQRPPEVLAPVLAARSLGIPTATFIFSWDNLASKGRIAAPFDHFLVWSAHMRAELERYYPEIAPERIHVVGTPQFDPYADTALLESRESFCRRIGADPSRPLVCYSGGDVGTCPDDPGHLRLLLERIRDGRIAGRPQVVLRPSPVDPGHRYAAVRAEYPELLFAPPAWRHVPSGQWARVMPLPEDVALLANLARHADLNVNTASTMTLDFALHDTPVVNVAFDVSHPPPLGAPLWEMYYQFEHYRPVVEFGAARIARSPDELVAHVNAYLADPRLDADARRRLVALELDGAPGTSTQRVLDAILRIAR